MNELDKEVFGFYKTTNKFIQKQKEKQMEYRNLDMSVIAYANGFTLWHYNGKNTPTDVLFKDGFFNPIYDLCDVGDIIIISADKETITRRISSLDERVVKLGKLS